MSNLNAWHGDQRSACAECVEAAKLGPKSPVPMYLLLAFMGGIVLSCLGGCAFELYNARTAGVHVAMLIMCFVAALRIPTFHEQIQGTWVCAYVNEKGVFHVHTELPLLEEPIPHTQFNQPYVLLCLGWGVGFDGYVNLIVNTKKKWTFSKQGNGKFILRDELGISVPGLSLRSILEISSKSTEWHEVITRGLAYAELFHRYEYEEGKRRGLEILLEHANEFGDRFAVEASAIVLLMEDSRGSMGKSKHAQLVRQRLTPVLEEGSTVGQRDRWKRKARQKLNSEQEANTPEPAEGKG